jgi:hypothetical protein
MSLLHMMIPMQTLSKSNNIRTFVFFRFCMPNCYRRNVGLYYIYINMFHSQNTKIQFMGTLQKQVKDDDGDAM